MGLIILFIIVGILCVGVCYKMTDSIFATTIFGAYITLIIISFSLFVLTVQ